MNHCEAQPWETGFRQDVGELFRLFSLPRMEYHSRGETGFWDLTKSHQFGNLFLSQLRKNIIYIIRTYFEDEDEMMLDLTNEVLGNYMHGREELSVTLYFKPRNPIGIKVSDEFTDGKKIATIERRRGQNEDAFGEPDTTAFDWLYGAYTQGTTDLYGEVSCSITLSIRNTREFVDYSVQAENYDRSVHNWVVEQNDSRLERLFS